VDGVRKQLLSGPAFAFNQNAAICSGDLLRQREDLLCFRILRQEGVKRIERAVACHLIGDALDRFRFDDRKDKAGQLVIQLERRDADPAQQRRFSRQGKLMLHKRNVPVLANHALVNVWRVKNLLQRKLPDLIALRAEQIQRPLIVPCDLTAAVGDHDPVAHQIKAALKKIV